MKKLVIALSLVATASLQTASALEVTGATALSATLNGLYCTFGPCYKEAAQIIKDTQQFNQTGEVSALLSQRISDLQAQDESLSTSEALDLLVERASESLE